MDVPMKMALDYDGTYTRDPAFWHSFVVSAVAAKHDVRIVTSRYPNQEVPNVGVLVLYTCMEPKMNYLASMGWMPDIWIDDHPERIAR